MHTDFGIPHRPATRNGDITGMVRTGVWSIDRKTGLGEEDMPRVRAECVGAGSGMMPWPGTVFLVGILLFQLCANLGTEIV